MEPGSFPIPVHPTPGRGASNPASEPSPANGPADNDLSSENDFGQVWDRAVGAKAPDEAPPANRQPSGQEAPSSAAPTDPVDFSDPDESSDEVGLAQMPAVSTTPQSAPVGPVSVQMPAVQGPTSPAAAGSPESPSLPDQPLGTDKAVLIPISPRPTGGPTPAGPLQVPDGSEIPRVEPKASPPDPALMAQTGMNGARKSPSPPRSSTVEGKNRPPDPESAKIAVPKGAGSAGSLPVESSISGKENFLTPVSQKVNREANADGIGDAMSGTRMRRPSENQTPMTASLNLNSRLVDGSLSLASSQARMGTMARIPSAGGETEALEIDSAREARPVAGMATAETRSGQAVLTQSLQAPRQAEAASVLESIHRMAEQASARSQDRLSMTLRFDDGSSVRIRLVREGGEFHTVIHTDQPGMESALRQQWSQFSQDAGDRGFKFLSMSFADLGGSAGQHRSSKGEDAQSDFSDLVDGLPTAQTEASSVESNSRGSGRSSTSSLSGSGRLRAWV